jgi:mannosylglycerate hydrolase
MRRVAHLIAHTHWDREWYLPLGSLRSRMIAMVDGLIELLERDPRVRSFLLDGQTVLLEDYLAVRPERRARLERLLSVGRIVTGPWYVLADEQIPAGESLLRNLALGRADTGCWTAAGGEVLYSPDAFGHPAVMPTVAREFGIATGLVWRGVDPALVGPNTLFRWRSARTDAELLTVLLPAEGYSLGADLPGAGGDLARCWRAVRTQVFPSRAIRHGLVMVGADHHAAAPDLGELVERLGAIDPSTEFRFSTLQEYFGAARGPAIEPPVLAGELRASRGHAWSLPGVATTRAPFKRLMSDVELFLTRQAEPLAALAGDDDGTASAILRHAWRELVQSQFHDVLGGCCADQVARAAEVRVLEARSAAEDVRRTALGRLAGDDPDLARAGHAVKPRLWLWNPAARPRAGVVTAEVSLFRRDILVGPTGNRRPRRGRGAGPFHLRADLPGGRTISIAPQIIAVRGGQERLDATRHYPDQDEVDLVEVAFPLPSTLDGLGLSHLSIGAGHAEPAEVFAAAMGRRLWNGRIMAGIDEAGLVSIGPLGHAPVARRLLALESERDRGDTYTFCPVRGDRPRKASVTGRPRVQASGPYLASVEWKVRVACGSGPHRGGGKVLATVRLATRGDEPFVRGAIEVDNQASDHRLRLRLPIRLRDTQIRAGAQFGWLDREPGLPKQGRRAALESPVATAPAHRWVAAARGDRGIALLLPGFFEYEWTPRGDLLLTLLRAVGELSRAGLATRDGHAGWPMPTPEAQCHGRETITFAISPITEDDVAHPDRIERMWEDAFVPIVPWWVRQSAARTPGGVGVGGITLDGDGLVFSACHPTEDGGALFLRCYNTREAVVSGAWRLGRAPSSASAVRADGTVLQSLTPAELLPIAVSPGALHTLRLTFDE